MGNRIVGIDLGTTSSLVAAVIDGVPRVIPDWQGRNILPSLVVVKSDKTTLVGHDAVHEARKYSRDNLAVASLKRLLERSREFTWRDTKLPVQLLAAMILAELRIQAEMYLGQSVEQAVIAVPASFNFAQRQFTKEAGRIAGLEVRKVVNEATASVCAMRDRFDGKVVAADLGGGTFDVSAIEFGDDVFEVKASNGDDRLGGDDFTQVIFDLILRKIGVPFDPDFLRSDRIASQRVRDAAEDAKHQLSVRERIEVKVPYIQTRSGGYEHLTCEITRHEFETEADPLVNRIERLVDGVWADAKLDSSYGLWLIGNASRIPVVENRLRRKRNMIRLPGIHDWKTPVALGAARIAGVFGGEVKDLLLLDVTAKSLGVEVGEQEFVRLIPKNTTTPTRSSQIFTTNRDNQQTVEIRIFEGEYENTACNRHIASLKIEHIRPAPAGAPEIEVTFDIDAIGILHVKAEDLRTKEVLERVCNDYVLEETSLDQYRQLVQKWICLRRDQLARHVSAKKIGS